MKDFKGELIEVLPKIHNRTFRYSQFEATLEKASIHRKGNALLWIDFALSKKEEMTVLDKAI
ncbi:MAG: hypothetical protein ACJAQ1_000992 [Flavobacterium sp.]|jgi:hypothetical protein